MLGLSLIRVSMSFRGVCGGDPCASGGAIRLSSSFVEGRGAEVVSFGSVLIFLDDLVMLPDESCSYTQPCWSVKVMSGCLKVVGSLTSSIGGGP